MYSKASASVPEPEAYAACLSVAPVSSSSAGEPVTLTGSENTTSISIRLPDPYGPSGVGETTPSTKGGRNADMTYVAPRSSLPLSSCAGPPTANSADPSPSRSPTAATEAPKRSPAASPGTAAAPV